MALYCVQPRRKAWLLLLGTGVLIAAAICAYVLWAGEDQADDAQQGPTPSCYYAIGNTSGRWGIIDRNKKLVVDFLYDDCWVSILQNKYVIGWQGGRCILSKIGGTALAEARCGIIPLDRGERLVALCEPDGCKIVTLEGQREIWEFAHVLPPHDEGPITVKKKDGNWGFIDESGNTVIGFRFRRAGRFSEGLCVARSNELLGYIDTRGAWVIEPQFVEAEEFQEGFAVVRGVGETQMWHIDRTGSKVFGRTWPVCMRFSEGLAGVMDESRRIGYIDRRGRVAIPVRFTHASHFSEGLAAVVVADRGGGARYGYINRTGQMVIEFEPPARQSLRQPRVPVPGTADTVRNVSTVLGEFTGGWARVQWPEGSGYINRKGEWVWLDGNPRFIRRLRRRGQ